LARSVGGQESHRGPATVLERDLSLLKQLYPRIGGVTTVDRMSTRPNDAWLGICRVLLQQLKSCTRSITTRSTKSSIALERRLAHMRTAYPEAKTIELNPRRRNS
jgi:hypothetical protein